jgi:hypothetical protein
MNQRQFTFYFKGGPITVWAFTEENAKILAQAEAIKQCWDPTIISRPRLEKLNMTINWNQLNTQEEAQLWSLLRKASYNGRMEEE